MAASNIGNSAPSTRSWYSIRNEADAGETAEVRIYDIIGGWGISADKFTSDLAAIKAKSLSIRINSPGGEVTEAAAIYNAIRRHPARVTIHIDGLAASAGSVVAMSGDEVRMADNAFMMIHEASAGVGGTSEDMTRVAKVLDDMNDKIAFAYHKKTGKPKSHWRKLMAEETWFTAESAKAEGLVDVVDAAEKPVAATAEFDLKIYNRVPAEVLAMFQKQNDPNQQSTTPEPSQSSDATPAIPTQETPTMADTPIQAAPAQSPAAGVPAVPQGNISSPPSEVARLNQLAIQGYIDQGKSIGRAEGIAAEQERFRKIIAVCPNHSDLAISAYLAGHDEKTAQMLFNIQLQAETKANAQAQAMEVEIARLNQFIATGGHPGVAMGATNASESAPALPVGLEPEQQAKLEWDSDPMIRAKHGNEKVWMLYRTNQLKGNVRVLKTA